jgi:hypothetical protein
VPDHGIGAAVCLPFLESRRGCRQRQKGYTEDRAHGAPGVEYIRTVSSVREFIKPRRLRSKMVTWLAGADEDKPEILRPYAVAHDSYGRLLITDPGLLGFMYTISKCENTSFRRGREAGRSSRLSMWPAMTMTTSL